MRPPFRPLLCGGISGGLLVLSLPKADLYPLAWFALAPVLAILASPLSGRRAAAAGYTAGLVYYAGTCYWIAETMTAYGGLPGIAAAGITILFCLVNALLFAAFAWLLGQFAARLGPRGLVLAPPLWVTLEWVRSLVPFGGFPWMLSGYALVPYAGLLQIVTWTGVYGLSFAAAAVNTAIAYAALRRDVRWAAAAVAAMAGVWALPAPPESADGDPVAVRMVQTAIPLDQPWAPPESTRLLDRLGALSAIEDSATGAPGLPELPRLIVWPETPAPLALNGDPDFRRRVSAIAIRSRAYVLIGYVDTIGDLPTNSAALIDPEGRIVSRYDKMHLVPFGEYVPMKGLLSFAGKLVQQVGDFEPGREFTVSPIAGRHLATVICYESIFPDLTRRFVARGAELLVVITDDAWFGDSSAPFQHLRMGIVRAVENRRYVVRVANTGITALIDPYGRIAARAPRSARNATEGVARFRTEQTFYTQHGDVFANLNVAAVLTVAAALAWRKKSGTVPNSARQESRTRHERNVE